MNDFSMITVEHLTKRYGDIIAVNDVSFSLNKGDIVGFLGPNGAGKTTTMRIITGCLAADSGRVIIGGYDILQNPNEAKRLIGYLPEQPPLYDEMTVSAYLDYVADLKDIPRSKKKKLKYMAIYECGLDGVYKRLIKHLSKGYRQRVGIAQAIINDPKILILDEPTIGLDPKQVSEIRELIKGLTGRRTVILSTHIIYEVTMICQKVVIINKGKIAAIDTLDSLSSRVGDKGKIILRVRYNKYKEIAGLLKGLDGILNVIFRNNKFILEYPINQEDQICESISLLFMKENIPILELRPERMSLEDIFVKIVTRDKG